RSGNDGEEQIPRAAEPGLEAGRNAVSRGFDPLRQPAQAEEDEYRGDDFDEELSEGEIGRREPDEGDAGDEPGSAHQDQGREAVELGLIGRSDGTEPADGPEQEKGGVEAGGRVGS